MTNKEIDRMLSVFTPPDEKRRLQEKARMERVGESAPAFVHTEVRRIARLVKANPDVEPEPDGGAFNRMTAEQRHYVAWKVGL